ncbi:uncharacterized protein PHALS_06992 [Plasmopara halstedii]|uniref:Uncharacterized protein n=1 Tax=Plasmopara halstedii TaxID=4781 RepID=A0A0P1B5C6_PLAHL|nr:uncharacterized protein PHALS_06992 [Plasmopara halstedii]CEG49220.1 hypothetical protein PHALS_06992 [Plasmopara halstedii]|eukprot:XP_024585589.1 hypothetical protein PHALS_06992 [Plasmopara halstedii]
MQRLCLRESLRSSGTDSSTPKKIFKIGKRLVQLHTHQYSSQSLMYMLESIN